MNEEWTRLDETNVPTDTSRALLLKRNDTQVVEYWWPPWTPFVGDGWNDIESYKYTDTPPEVPPTPELLPCRCGGEANPYHNGLGIECNDCDRYMHSEYKDETRRMWNDVNRPEEPMTHPELPTEPEMPDEVHAYISNGIRTWCKLRSMGTTHYRKEKTCTVKFNKSSTISGPTWTCAECGYNRILEKNKHCGNCGAKIERSET